MPLTCDAKYEKKIKFIQSNLLKQHEKVNTNHLKLLFNQIKHDGILNHPIIVDKNTLIILDGHHRFNTLKKLGLSIIPVYLVDYRSKEIEVSSWREGKKVTKELVIQAGLLGELLRPKTSKHLVPKRPKQVKIPLYKLI